MPMMFIQVSKSFSDTAPYVSCKHSEKYDA